MASLTNCEFMVKGYHYTEPTNPIRIDSCRLYLDTTINGEESNVGNEIWTVPATAFLDTNKTDLLHLKGIHGFYVQT